MEMYVADNSRGGVLEANGAASIKFRQKDIIATAHRLDPVLQSIDKQVLLLYCHTVAVAVLNYAQCTFSHSTQLCSTCM
jgi:acetyl-CoA carboxylase carboxyltransferase component